MVLIISALSFALFASVIVYASQTRQVTIDYKGQKIVVKTMSSTVKDVLKENQIELDSNDVVKPQLDQVLGSQNSISIMDTADQMLNGQSGISKQGSVANKIQLIKNNGKIQAIQKAVNNIKKAQQGQVKEVIIEKCKVSFKTERKPNRRMKKGTEKVIRQGKSGLVEKSFEVVYRDGKEVSRKLLSSKTVEKPVAKLVEYGTAATVVTSRGDSVRYKRSIVMRATAYSANYADTGKKPGSPGFGITATGMRARRGVVAVDPRVIPLGTRLYIESMQRGVPDYGIALAGDTGGAIKGNKIDLFFNTSREVDNWGVRNVKVYILE